MVEAILDGAGAGAAGRGLKAVDRMGFAILVDTATLQPVGGVGIAGIDFFQVAAGKVGLAHAAPDAAPAGDQEVPGVRMRGAPVIRIHPGALGQLEFGRVVGAIVDARGGYQRLRQHDPDAAGEGHLIGVEAVPAPATGALKIELPGGVRADRHFTRRVHDAVHLAELGCQAHVRMVIRNVDKGNPAVHARNRHGFQPCLQAAPTLFDDLVGKLGVVLNAFGFQHFFHQLADHVAAGNTRAFVQNPVLGGAHIALALVQPVTQRCVVDAGLATGHLQAVAEA